MCIRDSYTDMENLVTWLMTFGAKVEVLEPKETRDIIRRNAEETLKIYGGLGTVSYTHLDVYKRQSGDRIISRIRFICAIVTMILH